MLLGLISDIHGNLAALEAVIRDAEAQGAEKLLCLGDVVGYGPFPGECLDLVRRCGAVLMGNHEEALLHGAENFNPRARRAIDWTREHLQTSGDEETRRRRWQVLEKLQIQCQLGGFLFAHASPRQPTREYVMPRDAGNRAKMDEIFALIPHICFVGHTHLPGVFLPDGSFTAPARLWNHTYFIEPGEKALVNIGSVGQPRDGDPRACYALLDTGPETPRVIYRRVAYDVEATARAIEANEHLDNYLAERLRLGR
ncbi:MAG: metallophosphoesterase family protein [Planctomycetes bacterium]|nr:metallophosphoesterase family protein [Planctomycetota bacterium]